MLPALGIALAILLLWKGADRVVDSAAVLAQRIGISELVVGMTIVAMGTSAPEVAVSVGAAFRGQADLSIANVVGSNIFNAGLILGLCALLYGVPTPRISVYRDVPVLVGSSALLLWFMHDRSLERIEGLILLSGLIGYTTFLIHRSRRATKAEVTIPVPQADTRPTWQHCSLFALGLATVVIGAQLLVICASILARAAGWSDWMIGVTVVAGGTSLPELATSLLAARRNRAGIVIGNLVGSDIFNVLGVLGIAATVTVLNVDHAARTGLMVMLGFTLVLLGFMRSGWRVSRLEGAALIVLALWRWSLDVVPGFWSLQTPQ